MIRVAWLTDLHLNVAEYEWVRRMYDALVAADVDQIMISGDIAESGDVLTYLEAMVAELSRPIRFVLGNHDYYYSSIRKVRAEVGALCERTPELTYLTACDYVPLTERVALVGHDGWSDGRAGNYDQSEVILSDYGLIAELAGLSKPARKLMLAALGDEAARHVRRVLPKVAEKYPEVYFLTHAPPLREACWHAGEVSNDEWAPHFTCLAMGEAMLEVMQDYPDTRLTVLCGHTHGEGETSPLDNVRIITGGAEYGRPRITEVFELPT